MLRIRTRQAALCDALLLQQRELPACCITCQVEKCISVKYGNKFLCTSSGVPHSALPWPSRCASATAGGMHFAAEAGSEPRMDVSVAQQSKHGMGVGVQHRIVHASSQVGSNEEP